MKWATLPRRAINGQAAAQATVAAQGAGGSVPRQAGGRSSAHVDEMMDDSDTMSPIVDGESRQHRINLMRACEKAGAFVRSLQTNAGAHA